MKIQMLYQLSLYSRIISLVIYFSITCSAFALSEAVGESGINAYAVHQKGITGSGVNIGLLSAGNVRKSHIAFDRKSGSAVSLYDFTESGLSRSAHDTEMAGIILSNGSESHPDQIGVAPGAYLHSARFSNKQLFQSKVKKAIEALIKKHHCRIIITGIQLPKEIVTPDGNSSWSKFYDYYAETYDVIFTSAAGNSSPQVTVFGDLYNGITTAGMAKSDPNGLFDKIGSISNPGPTVDGRKKPDVAAPTQGLIAPTSSGDNHWKTLDEKGLGLTSYAVPQTSGITALLLEAAAKSPAENDDKSEVIKALIINAADPTPFNASKHFGSPADSITHWKPDSGYGKLDALNAYETLMAGPITQNIPVRQKMGWAYGVMDKNTTHQYQIQAAKGQRLVVTVTWHRKLSKVGNKYIEEPNRFYLDLKIISPSDQMLAFETPGRNNLIKTDLFMKEDGQYTIALKNPTSTENRDYGMAFEVLDNGVVTPSN